MACSAGDDELASLSRLLRRIGRAAIHRERTSAGYRLRLPDSDSAEAAVAEFARRDKACCPFLDFEISRVAGEIVLEVTGPSEAGRILDLSFDLTGAADRSAEWSS